jgi:hypothetical protein
MANFADAHGISLPLRTYSALPGVNDGLKDEKFYSDQWEDDTERLRSVVSTLGERGIGLFTDEHEFSLSPEADAAAAAAVESACARVLPSCSSSSLASTDASAPSSDAVGLSVSVARAVGRSARLHAHLARGGVAILLVDDTVMSPHGHSDDGDSDNDDGVDSIDEDAGDEDEEEESATGARTQRRHSHDHDHDYDHDHGHGHGHSHGHAHGEAHSVTSVEASDKDSVDGEPLDGSDDDDEDTYAGVEEDEDENDDDNEDRFCGHFIVVFGCVPVPESRPAPVSTSASASAASAAASPRSSSSPARVDSLLAAALDATPLAESAYLYLDPSSSTVVRAEAPTGDGAGGGLSGALSSVFTMLARLTFASGPLPLRTVTAARLELARAVKGTDEDAIYVG